MKLCALTVCLTVREDCSEHISVGSCRRGILVEKLGTHRVPAKFVRQELLNGDETFAKQIKVTAETYRPAGETEGAMKCKRYRHNLVFRY